MNAFKGVTVGLVVAAGFFFSVDSAQAGPKGGFGGGSSSKFSGGFGGSGKFHSGLGHGGHGHGGFGHSHKFHGGGSISGPFVPIHKHHWHDTSHYDHHPGRWVWNGFRWVYIPGHLHWHQDGHFHHYGH